MMLWRSPCVLYVGTVLFLCLGNVSHATSDPDDLSLLPVLPPPIPEGCNCNTLVAEKEGCCTPNVGRPFTMTPCLCLTCFKGTFKDGVCPPKPCICTREFAPVCCDFGDGTQRTASNPCVCENCGSGGEIVSRGTCPPTVTKVEEPKACICTLEFDPVCCENADGSRVTTGNPCQCERCGSGGEVISNGQCPPAVTCANVRCAGPGPCIDTPDGPICTTTVNPTCADLKCANCVDTSEGPVCGAVTTPPPVKPTCATLKIECANCVDTRDGPVCVPPGQPSCATLKCANCVDTKDGPVCGALATPEPENPCY